MAELKFPQAIPFAQNGRNCWVTKITVEDAITLTLPTQGQQLSMFDVTNRGIDEKHVKGIAKYLESTDWALPALILATSPNSLKNGAKGAITCDTNLLRVLDGQHRIRGITGTALNGNGNLMKQEMALLIIEVKNLQEQSQIWADFAKNKPIDGHWKEAVDNHTPFIRITKLAAEESAVLKGRVAIGKQAIKHNSPEMLTLSGLKQITATIALGIQRTARTNNQSPYAAKAKEEELTDRIVRFFDHFLPSCTSNYQVLATPEQFGPNVLSIRNATNAYDTQVLNVVADVHSRWLENHKPEEVLADYIGNLNMNKADHGNWFYRNGAYDLGKENYIKAGKKKEWEALSALMTDEAEGKNPQQKSQPPEEQSNGN